MKRVRYNGGSRSRLQHEGIVILGQYSNHQEVARALQLPVSGPGESVSVRLALWKALHGDAPSVELEGERWVVAQDSDPRVKAPVLPEKEK